jgi:hypothetical protein
VAGPSGPVPLHHATGPEGPATQEKSLRTSAAVHPARRGHIKLFCFYRLLPSPPDEKIQMKQTVETESYPIVYKTGIVWRIIFSILMLPLYALITWLMVYSLTGNGLHGTGIRIVLFLISLGLDIVVTYVIIWAVKYRVEVFSDKIVEIGLFKKKVIILDDIDGFRIVPTEYINQALFIPKGKKRKTTIALMMKDSNGFVQWLNASIKNLDTEDYNSDVRAILSDEDAGINEEQRADSFERARKFASFLNFLSIAAALWAIIWPQPYAVAVWSMIILPVIAVSSSKLFPGLIHFDRPQKGTYPTVAGAFIMPGAALSLRAFLDWDIYSWQNFWAPCAGISVCVFFLVMALFKDMRKKYGQAILLFVFCAVYGYGATLSLNGIHDKSIPVRQPVIIIDKHISTGTTTSYYLRLSPWGHRMIAKEVAVSKELYESTEIKDSVSIYVKKGTMKIPWFFVKK